MNFEKYANGKLYSFFSFFYKIVILSMLIFLTSLIGLFIFTFAASLISAIVLIKSSSDDHEIPIFLGYWLIFKKVFGKSLCLSLIYFAFSVLFAFNTYYFNLLTKQTSSMYSMVALYITIGLDILTILSFIMMVMVNVYYPYLKTINTIKYSFIMLFAFPSSFFMSLGLVIMLILCCYLFPYLIPVLIPGLFLYVFYLIYDKKLMQLVNPEGILPLDATLDIDQFRSMKSQKKVKKYELESRK